MRRVGSIEEVKHHSRPFCMIDNFKKYAGVKSSLLWGDENYDQTSEVSILMPVFRNSKFFREALMAALYQDFEGTFEVVICDNTPLDDSKTDFQKIVEEIGDKRVRYYRNEENIGMFPNWNRCIELAEGEYVTFAHDDDMLLPDALSTLMRVHNSLENKNAAIFPSLRFMDADGRHDEIIPDGEISLFGFLKVPHIYELKLLDIINCNCGMGGGCLFSRDKLIEIGGYSQDFFPSSDYVMHMAYVRSAGGYYCAYPTYLYRNANNTTNEVFDKFADIDRSARLDAARHIRMGKFIVRKRIEQLYKKALNSTAVRKGEPLPYRLGRFQRLTEDWFNKFICWRRMRLK